MIYRPLFAAACAAFFAAPLMADSVEWPQFRGPGGQGMSDAVNVPTEWSATKNVAWKIDIPGRGWSSPVVSDSRIYLTTAIDKPGGAVGLFAMCIAADSGNVLWSIDVLDPEPAAVEQMHAKNTPASATPIVAGGRLYVHFGALGTAAIDLSGKVLWRQTDLKFPPVHGNGGSPALVDGLLVFTCDGAHDPFVAALDADTGKLRWKTLRKTPPGAKPFSFSTPLPIDVDGKTQLVIPGSGYVGSYNPVDGAELWRVMYGRGYSVVPRPVYAHDMVFLSSGFDSPTLYAIKALGAAGDVTASHVAWTRRKGAPLTPSMLVVGDELYSLSDNGIATCADAVSGKVHWTERLDGEFSASPLAVGGLIYAQSEEGMGYVFKAGKTFAKVSEDDLGERSLASDAVIDGALFIRTEHHLWRVGGKL